MNFLLRAGAHCRTYVVLAGCETVQTTEAGAVGVTREQRVSSVVSSKEIEQACGQGIRAADGRSAEKGAA